MRKRHRMYGRDHIHQPKRKPAPEVGEWRCPACGRIIPDTNMALCLCPHCGVRVCEGMVDG